MNLECKLVKKTFNTDDGQVRDYYVLEFTLADGSTLDVPVKSDKAKILTMSYNMSNNRDKKPSFLK